MNDILMTPIRLNELEALIFNQVRKALAEVTPPKTDTVKNELLTVKQAAELLSVSVPTIYGYVHFRSIRCMKRRGRVYFSKSELLAWVQSGKRSTMDEINTNALKSLER
jgi:excisionase family DNA binding protein